MPVVNVERQEQVLERAVKRLAAKKDGATPEQLRAMKKKVRRAQRKRRRLAKQSERTAAKPKAGSDAS